MMTFRKSVLLLAIVSLFSLAQGCEQGPVEEAGEKIDEAVEETREELEEAGEEIRQTMKETGEKMQE